MTQKVLSYDVGGTKVEVGIVNNRGKVLDQVRVPAAIPDGKSALIDQMASLGLTLLKKHPSVKKVGIASAGPLDPKKGILLNPSNFITRGKKWGNFPIVRLLSQKLKKPVFLENDAAAAILAEHWVGAAKHEDNAMILTLGTGLGTGVLCNGELVRAGSHLHTEGGHMIIGMNDQTAPCGCGNLGCAEAYLSGRNFAKRVALRMGKPHLTAREIAQLARKGDPAALKAFEEYAQIMAVAIRSFGVLFNPSLFIFAGSFAGASDLFLPQTKRELNRLLEGCGQKPPRLVVSKLNNHSGLIGAAYTVLNR